MRQLAFLILVVSLAACSQGDERGHSEPISDPAAEEAYRALQTEARAGIRAWQERADPRRDPRPALAARLEEFAQTYPRSREAGEALGVALELLAVARETEGFFAAFDLMLQIAPNASGLRARLDDVRLMRMVQAGGLGITGTTDGESRRHAYRKAAPFIIEDLEKVIEATAANMSRAAAHFAAGRTCYELAFDLECAARQFGVVVEEFPDFPRADAARLYVESIEQLAVGSPAPNFAVQPVAGGRVALQRLRGKVVLVDFWATWCQSCIDDLPLLKRVHHRFRGRGLEIVSISVDRDVGGVREFVGEHQIEWPVVATGQGLDDEVVRLFRVQDVPMSFLIDRQGNIAGRSLFGRDVGRAAGMAILGTPEEP